IVLGVPHQFVVPFVRHDMIDHGCCDDPAFLLALNAQGMLREEPRSSLAPSVAVPASGCAASLLVILRRLQLPLSLPSLGLVHGWLVGHYCPPFGLHDALM